MSLLNTSKSHISRIIFVFWWVSVFDFCKWVVSNTSKSRISRMSRFTLLNPSCHTYEWVMSHIWMSHVTYMNESCRIYECMRSHIWMSHDTHMNESCRKHKWVTAPTNKSCCTYKRVMQHKNELCNIWMSCFTRIHGSCHAYKWVMSYIWMSHVTHMQTLPMHRVWMSHVT